MSQVRIRDLSKTYGGRHAPVLAGIDLDIAQGEFVVLVGPSGCGKSTLLRMIAGLETPSGGEIRIGDDLVAGPSVEVPPAERGIGMVFQDYALYPHMTVRENLEFGLKLRSKDRPDDEERERRVTEAARLLELSELLDRKPAQLSGGQRQRVAIGRALVKQPRVFLFDEPLSNLDARLRAETRVEIAALHRRLGSTSIYVTHDQVEAMTLADQLVVLKDGIVQQAGRPMDLYRDPDNRFVASFLGSPGMNFLDGRVDSRDGELVFAYTDGEKEGLLPLTFVHSAPAVPGAATLGLRPEALKVSREEPEGYAEQDLRLRGQVLLLEPHGHETHVRVSVGDARWVARVAGTEVDLKPGDAVWLGLDRSALYWFDAAGARARRVAEAGEDAEGAASRGLKTELSDEERSKEAEG